MSVMFSMEVVDLKFRCLQLAFEVEKENYADALLLADRIFEFVSRGMK